MNLYKDNYVVSKFKNYPVISFHGLQKAASFCSV